MKMKTIARLIPLLTLGMAAGQAGAAGFQLLEQNASGIGNAYAGSAAVAENASTIYFNPAGVDPATGPGGLGGHLAGASHVQVQQSGLQYRRPQRKRHRQ